MSYCQVNWFSLHTIRAKHIQKATTRTLYKSDQIIYEVKGRASSLLAIVYIGSPGVGRNTFLSSPHLCFIIVFICDLFVSRDDPLMS